MCFSMELRWKYFLALSNYVVSASSSMYSIFKYYLFILYIHVIFLHLYMYTEFIHDVQNVQKRVLDKLVKYARAKNVLNC